MKVNGTQTPRLSGEGGKGTEGQRERRRADMVKTYVARVAT
jgi:hypothetical protein